MSVQKLSKRFSVRHQHKIIAKVTDHHRKLRRLAKKNPSLTKASKKDPGIPNLFPFKEQLLQQAQKQKEQLVEQQKKLKEQKRLEKLGGGSASAAQFASLQYEAARKAAEFEDQQDALGRDSEFAETTKAALSGVSRRAYYREFKKVIQSADVILEVLDARDPLGCRCPDIEKMILTKDPNKKIVLVLNKIDLVPREIVLQWIKYLRAEFPVIAFRSNTQKSSRKHLASAQGATLESASEGLLHSGATIGAENLMSLLKNYSRSQDIKKKISVGIIGYPNVGKSSLINSLKRERSVGVGNTPGFTKVAQEIELDSNIRLLDCPGIIFSSGSLDSDIILRNCVKVEQLEDPITPVDIVVRRCKAERLMDIYGVPAFKDSREFLLHLARKRGKMLRGGIPDLDHAARSVLTDWNNGRIPFFTVAPESNVHARRAESVSVASSEAEVDGSVQIVDGFSKAFELEDLFSRQESFIVSNLPSLSETVSQYIAMESSGAGKADASLFDDSASVMDDESASAWSRGAASSSAAMGDEEAEDEDSGDDYDFKKDFKSGSKYAALEGEDEEDEEDDEDGDEDEEDDGFEEDDDEMEA